MVLLSTDSPEDLSTHKGALVRFSRNLPSLAEVALLAYPNQWFVGSRHSCSCGFRHLYIGSVSLGFAEPQDWYPEEAEDIEATLRFVGIVKSLLAVGASVDCIDAWGHEPDSANLSETIQVNLSEVRDRDFRFFENHRLVFSNVATGSHRG